MALLIIPNRNLINVPPPSFADSTTSLNAYITNLVTTVTTLLMTTYSHVEVVLQGTGVIKGYPSHTYLHSNLVLEDGG